jgi:type IV pilus assembly protein PilW
MISKPSKYKRSKRYPLSNLSGNQGFTLAELMLAMGIMMIVLTAIISLFTSLNRMYTTQGVAAGVQQVTRAGIDIMTRNIRMAGFDPLGTKTAGIFQATANSIRFKYDPNGAGTSATDGDEDIAYSLDADKKPLVQKKNGSGTPYPMIDHVDGLTFSYLDADGDTVTTDLNAIRTVVVSLTVDEPAGRDRVRRTYSTRVICRNLNL